MASPSPAVSMSQNMVKSPNAQRPLVPGVYVPIITVFNEDPGQTIDYKAHEEHILYMARGGVQGFLCQGSTAEAVALTISERAELTRVTRRALDDNGFQHIPLIVGVGAQSTQEAISLAIQAKEADGDFVISLPPSYFAGSLNSAALEGFYSELGDKSPLPVIIYSYPGASSGLELDSEAVARLAKHPNIVGIKQTDHNIGKMARIVYQCPDFVVLGGASDYFIGALSVGAQGTITGIANIFPRLSVHLFNLYYNAINNADANSASLTTTLKTAQRLQGQLSACEWHILKGGIPSIKYACKFYLGRGGVPRRPVPESSDEIKKRIEEGLQPLMEMEKKLAQGITDLI